MEAKTEWITAAEAKRMLAQGLIGTNALLRRLKAGMIPARSDRMIIESRDIRSTSSMRSKPIDDEPVPQVFWDRGCDPNASLLDWSSGDFRGSRFVDSGRSVVFHLFGVQFETESVRRMLPAHTPSLQATEEEVDASDLPPVSEAKLRAWFDGYCEQHSGVENIPAVDEVWETARLRFPDKKVTRERIRALAPSRRPGPKPIRQERSA